ncbi:MAG: hypothetical protein EBS01_05145 [Verrucomicrobia bacterium]|nr:hypothetical protein [Verrucomicrobiota bacterium]
MSTPESHTQPPQINREVLLDRIEGYTRSEPAKALSASFGIGILLTLFPFGGLVTGISRLLFLLARPLLMILGVVKIAQELEARRPKSVAQNPSDPAP